MRQRLTFAALWALVLFYVVAAPIAAARDADFTHMWVGGAAWLEGAPYDPALQETLLSSSVEEPLWAGRNDQLGAFFYPPPALLLYGLLALLPVQKAALVMALLNTGLGVLSGWMLSRLSSVSLAAGVAIVLLYPSTFFAYVLGQNGPLTLCLCLGAAMAVRSGRPLLMGLLLGCLAWKPSWLFAVSWLWLLVPGRRRALLGFLLGAGGLVLLSLPMGGWPEFLELLPRLATLSEQGDYPAHLQYNLQGLSLRFGALWPGWLAAAAVVGVTLWKGQGRLAAGLAAATLINPHLHHYDALPALLAVAVLAGRRSLWWVLPFHLAFVASEALHIQSLLPLPTLAMLAVWALSLVGDPEPQLEPSGPIRRLQGSP